MEVLEKLNVLESVKINLPKVQVVVLDIKTTKILQQKMLGKSMAEWVAFAGNKYSPRRLDYDYKKQILEFMQNNIDSNYDYTLILLSTTPLITVETIDRIIEYATIKNASICKLPAGYICKNKDIVDGTTFVDCIYSQDMEDFYIVESKKQFNYAVEILQDRINSFHMENGVEILKPKSVYIEPTVDIEDNVKIFPGNSIKGNTNILNGVMLKENNVIENVYIGENCCISNCVIRNSKIGDNVYIAPFCEIENSIIHSDAIIDKGCSIKNFVVEKGSKIQANMVLGDTNDSDSGAGKSWQ